MKTTYKKLKTKIITYHNYKSFSNDSFREASQQILEILFQNAIEF